MSPLQWALLVVGAVAVIAIYVYSRRRPPAAAPVQRVRAAPVSAPPPATRGSDQMDMFARGGGEFDEFGVGRPRKRVAPAVSAPAAEPAPAPAAAPAEPAPSAAQAGAAEPPAAAPEQEKLVALLIAEREGTAIFGPKIHAALRAQGLRFGERRIYHRIEAGKAVFSVASLVKPGILDPAEQQSFSTPGLSLFMLLPGPMAPETAIGDMVGTARALAQQLNAEVFDSNRELLTAAAEKALIADVKAWARQRGL